MSEVKKDQEREELHKAIWSIANDLRGSIDGWDFKQYVLGIITKKRKEFNKKPWIRF